MAQHAEVHYPSLTITIAAGLKQRERNAALMHEVVHLERGSVHSADTEREEPGAFVHPASGGTRRHVPADR